MTDDELKEMLSRWQQHSEEMLNGYVANIEEQYKQLVAESARSMQEMIDKAQQANAESTKKPEEVHMKWIDVEDKRVLLFSEKAGKEVIKVFDLLAKLIPELQKRVK